MTATPIVIAHRGASGARPEHTLAAYELAIDMGADYIEPDLVMTRDGVLVARHENEISETTDVADRGEFAGRKTTKTIDGQAASGWFVEDFTLAEIKTLRARQRLRFRDQSFNGRFDVPTLSEIIALVKRKEADLRRRVGLYIETKHPTYFRGIGLPLEEPLLRALAGAGYRERGDPVFIQSFEAANLRELRKVTKLRLIQLLDEGYEWRAMLSPSGLRQVAAYADGIGPSKRLIVPADAAGRLGRPTSLVNDAHAAGLLVHPWTFRSDRFYLAAGYVAPGDEYAKFFALGVDGVFSDFPDAALRARDARKQMPSPGKPKEGE